MEAEQKKTKCRPRMDKHQETCTVCGEIYLAAYHMERHVCRHCQVLANKRAFRERKRAEREKKKRQQERSKMLWQQVKETPRDEFGLVCPYSPDCEKCPLADCKMNNAHRYNIKEYDLLRNRDGD